MQLPYFFEKTIEVNDQTFVLGEETSKHCIQVLRMKVGEKLELTNGKGLLCTATIIEANKKNAFVKIEKFETFDKVEKQVSIAISPLKNASRFEWFLEKAVEIGVAEIIPIICKRTEKQHSKYERWNGIIVSAMLQSRQVWLPVLHETIAFNSLFLNGPKANLFIAFCDEAEQKKNLVDYQPTSESQILIGPEGDFTIDEVKAAFANNFLPVSLGKTRLRTETAGIVAACILINN